jgi:hypothetical protein
MISYLTSNFKYVLLAIVLSLVAGYFIHEYFFDYWLEIHYGGRQTEHYKQNNGWIDSEIIGLRDFLKILAWGIGIFIVPITYFFKKKSK